MFTKAKNWVVAHPYKTAAIVAGTAVTVYAAHHILTADKADTTLALATDNNAMPATPVEADAKPASVFGL